MPITAISSWGSFIDFINTQDSNIWLYRGQKDSTWQLSTTLERAASDYHISLNELPKIEQGMIRKFHRHLTNYSIDNYNVRDYFKIVSLMQHHGCPTRFLDFTHSPYIGLFFAIENAEVGKSSAIWSINSQWLDLKYKHRSSKEYITLLNEDPYEKSLDMMSCILKDRREIVKHIGPYEMNDRLLIQQGTFIVPMNIKKTFMKNLFSDYDKDDLSKNIVKIVIDCNADFIKEAYLQLYRMNITRATLFPGIDGFTSHLKMLMLLPNTISSTSDYFE